ncbi:coproporphyrinogen III oxidase [Bacteroidia bacterium]|nr:coproporphyrinogen III oxidase [Bacteroidia bacterium]
MGNLPVETIYFGGGTPSQLPATAFEKIFAAVGTSVVTPSEAQQPFPSPEITLEANPDDLTDACLDSLCALPFNRLSIGIQSFDAAELRFLHRRHDAQAAVEAVERAQRYGFDNISIDLMYGLPHQTLATWQATLDQAIRLGVQHISAYHLIYEAGTRLHQWLKQGKIAPLDEETSLKMFEMLIDTLAEAGFRQYEISNFALPGRESRHNSAYWSGRHYLGIGAAAHSYNGISRQWNAAIPTAEYLNHAPEIEFLDETTVYNDFIITRLRTMRGINLNELTALCGEQQKNTCLQQAQRYLDSGRLTLTEDSHLRLTRAGIFISDGIMADLMR